MRLTPETVTRLLAQGMPAEKLAGYLNPDGTVRSAAPVIPAPAGPTAATGAAVPRVGAMANRILATAAEHPDWHAQQIADLTGAAYGYVVQTVNAHGVTIARKPPKTAFADEATVAAVYADLQSVTRTAFQLGVSYGTVRNRLMAAGVQRRPPGRSGASRDPYAPRRPAADLAPGVEGRSVRMTRTDRKLIFNQH